jgi:hypothetical protein
MRYIIPDQGIKRPRGVCIVGGGEMFVGEAVTGITKRIKYMDYCKTERAYFFFKVALCTMSTCE